MNLAQILLNISPLPNASLQELEAHITLVEYPKGRIIIKQNKVEPIIYFIKKGMVRAYADIADNEVTFWFGAEGDPVISMKSYVSNEAGYEDIILSEDCELYQLEITQLQLLFEKDIHIANWGRKFAEKELIKTEERLIALQFHSAKERYLSLLHSNPKLLQRVSLGHIASYLGITQVSLSRIRAEIR